VFLVAGHDARAAAAPPKPVAQVAAPVAGLQVRASPAAAWEPAAPNLTLLVGSALKTAAAAQPVELADGTQVVMDPGTVVQFQASTEINVDAAATTRVGRVDLKAGSMAATIPPTGRPLLVMASNDVYAAFKPGSVRAKVAPDGMLVVVGDGTARVASQGRWSPLGPRQYQTLVAHGKQEAPKPLAPKPAFAAEPCHADGAHVCAIAVVTGNASAPIGVRWGPAAPGFRYAVALARDPAITDVLVRQELEGSKTAFVSAPLAAGRYWVSVSSSTEDGIDGGSAVRAARVVRIAPEGSASFSPKDNTVVLPARRKVMVPDASGLQASYGDSGFGPVPGGFELTERDRSRTLRIKMEGDATDDAVVTLERRTLQADVDMSPKTARWPQDPVTVTLRLVDPRKRESPASVKPWLRVRVNTQPVQSHLAQVAPDTWRTVISPRNGNGPWVIRVEALDEEGNVLGRGALEVVGKGDRPGGDKPPLW
jgi:hypothetical protein